MSVTEEQAKEKWCPFARRGIISRHFIAGGMNRVGDDSGEHTNPEQCRCIASQCMAWRWNYPPEEAMGNRNGPIGFCGLTGQVSR
jgi:hypothetical protein